MKPPICQLLTKGKILCGKVFPNFADTWNYIVHRSENIKGDKDLDPKNGHILVDNTDPEHPVVRWQSNEDGSVQISGDSQFQDETSSITVTDRKFNGGTKKDIMLYHFDNPDDLLLTYSDLSNENDSRYKILVRDDEEGQLKYANLSLDLSTSVISGDANTGAGLSSIRRFNDSNGDYLGLYNFEQPDRDFTLGIDFGNKHLDSKYKILVRDDQTKTLRYADLSVDISGSVDLSALSSAISAMSSDISAMSSDISAMSSDIADISANMKADSEVPAIELSSVQRYSYVDENQQPHKAYMLYHFDNPDDLLLAYSDLSNENDSRYKILVRDDEEGQLKYANLSLDLSTSVISGDSNATEDRKSIELVHEDSDFLQLYHFDDPDDLLLNYGDLSNENNSRYKILVRDDEEGQLKYANLSLDISALAVISGDSNATQDRKSIELVNEDSNFLQLYGFDQDNGNTFRLIVPNYYDYYYSGSRVMSQEDGEPGPELVVREKTSADREIDYQQLSVQIPPFVHGDADNYPETNRKSIDSVTFAGSPDKSYYQLHDFDAPDAVTVNNDLTSAQDYYNLATGAKSGETGDENDYFILRDRNGDLVYKKIYVKADGGESWDEQRIENIENNIAGIEGEIDELDEKTDKIDELDEKIDKLDEKYWIKGGDATDNYGSSIGNTSGNMVIDLDNRYLFSSNTVVMDIENNKMYDVVGHLACDWNERYLYDYNGHPVVNFSSKSLADTNGRSSLRWQDRQLWDNSGHKVAEWNSNQFTVTNTLKIGNTTLNETQLQRLLALIS